MKTKKNKQEEPETIKNIETQQERKLNWLEKKAIKSFLKKTNKATTNLIEAVKQGLTDKEEMIKALLELSELLDITNEKDQPITRKDYEQMTIKELTDTFEEALQYMQRNV